MRKGLLFFLLVQLSVTLTGQSVKGRILDADTKRPIPHASVFFDGTFHGTSSDELGRFHLDVSPYLTRSLTISAIGYFTHTLEKLDTTKYYLLLLGRDRYEIEEVSITGVDIANKRKAHMRLFRSEFIGASRHARKCRIINEEDITFNYGSDKDTLRASARKPLVIHNKSLGYHFEYHLESFEFVYKTQSVSYKGTIIFTRDLALEGYREKYYRRMRKYAYTGSCKEFIRTLWTGEMKSTGYSLRYYDTLELLSCDDVVVEDEEGNKFLEFAGDVEIWYYNYLSGIKLLKEKAYFDKDGFYDPEAISWGGFMSAQRIADFLPYEYSADTGK